MQVRDIIGLLIGFAIGFGCNWLDIPVPAPPALMGALLVVSITSGYVLTDWYLTKRHNQAQVTKKEP